MHIEFTDNIEQAPIIAEVFTSAAAQNADGIIVSYIYLVEGEVSLQAGVFLKSDTEEELYRAITMVGSGRTYTPPSMTEDLINRDSKNRTLEGLTQREKTTLTLMAQGFP